MSFYVVIVWNIFEMFPGTYPSWNYFLNTDFMLIVSFYTSRKHKKQSFSVIFKRFRKRQVPWNRLKLRTARCNIYIQPRLFSWQLLKFLKFVKNKFKKCLRNWLLLHKLFFSLNIHKFTWFICYDKTALCLISIDFRVMIKISSINI